MWMPVLDTDGPRVRTTEERSAVYGRIATGHTCRYCLTRYMLLMKRTFRTITDDQQRYTRCISCTNNQGLFLYTDSVVYSFSWEGNRSLRSLLWLPDAAQHLVLTPEPSEND